MVGVLVLQAEGLVCAIRYLGFLFQTSPTGVVAEPQEVAVFIGHLTRDADLVAVEVMGLLSVFSFCGCSVADLRQRFVGVLVGVDIGVATVKYGAKRSSENIESDLHPFSWTDIIKLLFGFFLRIYFFFTLLIKLPIFFVFHIKRCVT